VFAPGVAERTLASISRGLTLDAPAITMLLESAWAWGNLNMQKIAQVVLFISACAFLFGLTAFLFREQLASKR
jgi:hypothetical protein